MVASAIQEHLGFVFEATKRSRVDYPVTVSLIMGAPFGRLLRVFAVTCLGAELGVGRQYGPLAFFKFLPGARHDYKL
jgi:hypothetical protein